MGLNLASYYLFCTCALCSILSVFLPENIFCCCINCACYIISLCPLFAYWLYASFYLIWRVPLAIKTHILGLITVPYKLVVLPFRNGLTLSSGQIINCEQERRVIRCNKTTHPHLWLPCHLHTADTIHCYIQVTASESTKESHENSNRLDK